MLREHPDGYYDTRETASERDLDTYMFMVFDENWQTKKPKVESGSIAKTSLESLHKISKFIPADNGNSERVASVKYEWDLEGGEPFGGITGFFSENTKILDLGSGKGIAKDQINEKYSGLGVKCVSLDFRYLLQGYDNDKHPFYEMEIPQNSADSVAGEFGNLPFADNTFDRMLSVETFPAWLPKDSADFERYFREVTRVCQKGTIWRGTSPTFEDLLPNGYTNFSLQNAFCKNGWEVIIPNARGYFAAHLVKK